MSLTILIVLVPIVILSVVVFVIFSVVRGTNKAVEIGTEMRAEVGARMARALPAQATIVQAQTIVAIPAQGKAAIALTLDIASPSGERYQARSKWEVDLVSLSRVQAGQSVAVKIDAQDKNWIFPGESWARPYGDGR